MVSWRLQASASVRQWSLHPGCAAMRLFVLWIHLLVPVASHLSRQESGIRSGVRAVKAGGCKAQAAQAAQGTSTGRL